MSRVEVEPYHSAWCTLRQFYNWIEKREKALGNFWNRVSGTRIDEIEDDLKSYLHNGGYIGMTGLKFYLIDNFMRDHDPTQTFYLIATGLMIIPFEMWDHIMLNTMTGKFWITTEGQAKYKAWCDAHPDKHFTTEKGD